MNSTPVIFNYILTYWEEKTYLKCKKDCLEISFGKLVLLGFGITAFRPAAYQGRSLQPPLYGNLILKLASCLDAFSTYPFPT